MASEPRIEDHAVIGDGRSAALVCKDGAIDWLCWPRFDSPSVFAALLDAQRGGFWRIAPTQGLLDVERFYEADTNVLVTRFHTASGILRLTDFMAVGTEAEKRERLWPEHQLIRVAECEDGEVQLTCTYDPRPDYGRMRPPLRQRRGLGLRIEAKGAIFNLRSNVEHHERAEGGMQAEHMLRAGERASFSLTFEQDLPAVISPLERNDVDAELERTRAWWRAWVSRCTYAGPYRDAVVRSLLVLKLLTYAPSGAILAAATTSLPERPGGELNWDYRYCWLRDASFTVRALDDLGYPEEAEAFCSWLLHSTRLTRPKLHVLYDVHGGTPENEVSLTHLSGYRGARPVRVGNAAATQFQLDCHGEVIDGLAQLVRRDRALDRLTQRMLVDLGDFVCRNWHLPDAGIWEIRGPHQHFTHSKVLCWAALDRLLEMHEHGKVRGLDVAKLKRHRDAIRDRIEADGWNERLQAYTQVLGGSTLDASVLLMGWYGYRAPDDPRLQSTYRAITERLTAGRGLLYRYEQSRAAHEGAFGFCTHWAVEYLARGGGTLREARGMFAETLRYANDVGLFAEEIDPESGSLLGNFPQAFTHVGLITAALALQERTAGHGEGARSENRDFGHAEAAS